MGKLVKKASINMLLVLVVMKLALLIIIIEIDRVFTYKKIFNNEQETHNKQLNINAKLTKIANSQIKLWQKVGFLPDDLSFLCDHGINIHQINIDQQLYGYWGARALISVDLNLKKQKTLYFEMLLQSHDVDLHQLQLVDLFGVGKVDQVFFLDQQNCLWRYDVATNKLFLQSAGQENINYVVANDMFNITNNNADNSKFQLQYIIYVHARENNLDNNKSQDFIKVIYANQQDCENSSVLKILTSEQRIANFFLYYNYIIIMHEDIKLEPIIYKIGHKKSSDNVSNTKIMTNKIDVKFKSRHTVLDNCRIDINLPRFKLSWDPNSKLHKIEIMNNGCELLVYEFNLPNDNMMLSFRIDDCS